MNRSEQRKTSYSLVRAGVAHLKTHGIKSALRVCGRIAKNKLESIKVFGFVRQKMTNDDLFVGLVALQARLIEIEKRLERIEENTRPRQ